MPFVIEDDNQPQFRVQIPGDPRRVISVRQHNPGNTKGGILPGSIGTGPRGFDIYPSNEAGFQAVLYQIGVDAKRGLNLAQFAHKYAPSYENDTNAWIRTAMQFTGASPNTPLANIDPMALGRAIIRQESSATIGGGGQPQMQFASYQVPQQRPQMAQGRFVIEDEEPQKPQAKAWTMKASEIPALQQAAAGKPQQAAPAPQEAPGIVAAIQRWRNRPLPSPEEKEKAIAEAADWPGWKRQFAFSTIRAMKGLNPGGVLREQGLEAAENVFEEAEKRASGSGYGMVSQAVPWAFGAMPMWETGAGVAQAGLRNIPGAKKIARAAEELPGLLQRGAGVVPKLKGAGARALTGAVTIPAMDVARGKLPGPWDVAMGAGFGAVLGPGAFRMGEAPKPRPGTVQASEQVAEQQKAVESEIAEAFGGKAGAVAPAAPAAESPPLVRGTFKTTPEPLVPEPHSLHTPVSEIDKMILKKYPAPASPWTQPIKPSGIIKAPSERPRPPDMNKLKQIEKDISMGLRGTDPGVRTAMEMIGRLTGMG